MAYPIRGRMAAFGRGCVKTQRSHENGRAQHDFRRLPRFWPLRMLENSTKFGMNDQSPEFSHSLDPKRTLGTSSAGGSRKITGAEG
jgi:hypothetical protein